MGNPLGCLLKNMMSKILLNLIAALGLALTFSAVSAPAAQAKDIIKIMQKDLGGRRPKGCPSKWCACYMDLILQKAGYTPRGSYRARDFATYGKKAKPMSVGSIMVMRNHVGIVAGRCEDGRVKLISGNYSKKVAIGCYSPKKAIAWRIPA